MTDKLNSINYESEKTSSKNHQFVENTKRAVKDTLIKTGIIASTIGFMATSTSFANETEPTKPKIEMDDNQDTMPNPDYTPYPGSTDANFPIVGKDLNTSEVTMNNLANKLQEYKAIEVKNIKPVDILPIIGQVEEGDEKCYEHIEHLRIAEATRIRDMMWEYGAGNHSPEEYQQLMMRLNTGMLGENPKGYTNYESVGGDPVDEPSNHAHDERHTLNTLVNHANFKVINPGTSYHDALYNLCKEDPNKINIMGVSIGSDLNAQQYNSGNTKKVQQYDKEPNRLIFGAGGNVRPTANGTITNKAYQEDYDLPDEHSVYTSLSRAHNKTDNTLDRHLMITFGTNAKGDVDITRQPFSNYSKFPVGFHPKVLFSGRAFPYLTSDDGEIEAERRDGYATSHTNYVNVAIADLCFQMFSEVKDVDELLEMIRSTALTDYIRLDLNGDGDTNDTYDSQSETQPLMLMNPAGFFQKYLMPTALPTSINENEAITLEKGYYHGIIYQIPGAEVNINGQRIAFTDKNKDLILTQNPMTLEWRLNGELLNMYNYKPGDTISGQILVVDDKWNGLNITKNFSISIDDVDNIYNIHANTPSNERYTIDGIHLDTKPTKPGIYIINGQKIIIK